MAKTKATHGRKPIKSDNAPKNDVTTPADLLKAAVFIIGNRAKTRPANSLIGNAPHQTVSVCRRIIHNIACLSRPNPDDGLVCVDPAVLHLVIDALEHVEGEARALWTAAEGMANSLPEVA